MARFPAAVRARHTLVGEARVQGRLRDLPADPTHGLAVGRGEQAVLACPVVHVDHRATLVELRIVGVVIEATDEERLVEGVGLDSVDGGALFGAAAQG
jgi:hypothetical protein